MSALSLPRAGVRTEVRTILGWWLASRVVTFAAFAVLGLIGPQGWFGPRMYAGPLGLLGAWDGVWYLRIAEHGYVMIPGRESDPAFFPLFPIILRVGHELTHASPALVGVVVANVALAVALVAFYDVGRRVVGAETAQRATLYAAFCPLAFVYSMVYPMSLLLAFACLALLAGFRQRWLLAAAFAALAALTRPEAIVLSMPLAAIAWRQRQELDAGARGRAVAAVLAAPAAIASYPLYLKWSLGDARAWSQSERFWGRSFALDGPVRAVRDLAPSLAAHPGFARDLVLVVVYAVLLVAARRHGVSWPWIASGAALIVAPLFSGTVESEGRFGLLCFAAYWGLAAATPTRRAQQRTVGVLVTLLVAGVLTLPYVWP